MNRLEKTIISLAAGLIFTGCQSSTYSSKKADEYDIIINVGSVNKTDIQLHDMQFGENPTVEQLMSALDDNLEYLDFRMKYGPQADMILKFIKSREMDRADFEIRSLAGMLEQDGSTYAKEYLEKLKNYNYLVIHKYDVTRKTTKKGVNGVEGFLHLMSLPAAFLTDIVFIMPMSSVLSDKPEFMATEKFYESSFHNQSEEFPMDNTFTIYRITPVGYGREVLCERADGKVAEDIIKKNAPDPSGIYLRRYLSQPQENITDVSK